MYCIWELFPVELCHTTSVAWKHLSVAEPLALTSGVKVSQALPVCGFSQDPLTWCERRKAIKYRCFVYLTQSYQPAAL